MTEPTIYDLRIERGPYCEWCEYLYSIGEIAKHERQPMEQRHHCIVKDTVRFHKELTVVECLMGACSYHHTGVCVLDAREIKMWFWSVQCERYGPDRMQKWLLGLPQKLWDSGRIDKEFLAGEFNGITRGQECACARTRERRCNSSYGT